MASKNEEGVNQGISMNFLKRLFGRKDSPLPLAEVDYHDNKHISPPPPTPFNATRSEVSVSQRLAASQYVDAGPWRARPLFISSTFRDMHAERDHLRDRVFPELEERLRSRRQSLEPIDLRLGVEVGSLEDEQHTRELLVLKVCLAEIERSRPFLLVLLGDRYGWVPPEPHVAAATQEAGFAPDTLSKSVTALEIEFGILKSHPSQKLRSRFYFRNPLPYEDMPPEEAAIYSDAYSSDHDVRDGGETLQLLKETIASDPSLKGRVRRYSLDWDLSSHKPTQSSLESWGRQVLADLWSDIEEETREYAAETSTDKDEQERQAIEEFIQTKVRDFKGHDDLLRTLEDCAFSPGKEGATWGACVKGEPGSGKSSLFSALCYALRTHVSHEEQTPPLILINAAGATPYSSRIDTVLLRFVKELGASIGREPNLDEDDSSEDIEKTFRTLLDEVARHRRVIILLDAVDQLERTVRSKQLAWIPLMHWPLNARLFATSHAGQTAEILEQWAGVEEIDLPAVEQTQAREIARAVWRRYHRECNPEVLAAVLERRDKDGRACYGNPLWLTLAMEHLNLLDVDDFNRAGQNIHGLLREMASTLPLDIPGLYALLLARCEKLFGMAWVRSFACLTALGRTGWRESDIMSLISNAAAILFADASSLKWDPLQFAAIRRSFRSQIIQRGEHGAWDCSHQQLRLYICQTYLQDANIITNLEELITAYLFGLPNDDPLRQAELMYHAIQSRDGSCAGSCLSQEIVSRDHVRDLADFIQGIDSQAKDQSYEWFLSLFREQQEDFSKMCMISRRFIFSIYPNISCKTTAVFRARILQDVKSCLDKFSVTNADSKELHFISAMILHSIGKEFAASGDTLRAETAFNAGIIAFETAKKCDAADASSNSYDSTSEANQVSDEFLNATSAAAEAFSLALNTIDKEMHESGHSIENTTSNASQISTNPVASDKPYFDFFLENHILKALKAEDDLITYGPLSIKLGQSDALIRSGNIQEAKQLVLSILEDCKQSSYLELFTGVMESLTRATAERLLAKIFVCARDMDAARIHYESCLAILNNIVEHHPNDMTSVCIRIESLIEYGTFLTPFRRIDEIRDIFSKCLNTTRSYVEAGPEDVNTQLLLVKACAAFGISLSYHKQYEDSLALLKQGLVACKRLLAVDKNNTTCLGIESKILYHTGEVLNDTGNAHDALTNYQACLCVLQVMENSLAQSPDIQLEIIRTHNSIGEILQSTGHVEMAIEHYTACQEIFHTVSKGIFFYYKFLYLFLVVQEKIGDITQGQGDIPGALRSFQICLETSSRLNDEHPEEAMWQVGKLFSSFKTAEAQRLTGDTSSALKNFQSCLQTGQKLIRIEPSNMIYKRALWASHYKISTLQDCFSEDTRLHHLRQAYELLSDAKFSNANLTTSEEKLLRDLFYKFS